MLKDWVSNKDLKSPYRLILRYMCFLVRSESGDVEISAAVSSVKPRPMTVTIQVFLPAR